MVDAVTKAASITATLLLSAAAMAQPAPEPPPNLEELSHNLESQVFDLFAELSRTDEPSANTLLHAHNLLGAAKSFADLASDEGPDREFLALSFALLQQESRLLFPLLSREQQGRPWSEIQSTLDALDALVAEPHELAAPAESDDVSRPRVELLNDGWHGNMLERFVRIKGKLHGTTLKQGDLIITDGRNRVVWEGRDQIRQIADYYQSKPWTRSEYVTIRFSIRIPGERLEDGENFITLRLSDESGRESLGTVAVGK